MKTEQNIYNMSVQELVQELNEISSKRKEIRRLLLKYIKENIKKPLSRPIVIAHAIRKIDGGEGGKFTDNQLVQLVNFIKTEMK